MPRIGVFWYYKGVVFGRAIDLKDAEEYGTDTLDSSDTHTDLWDNDRTLLRDFPELYGTEYFNIPRGRILWKPNAESAMILMDSVLFDISIHYCPVNS